MEDANEVFAMMSLAWANSLAAFLTNIPFLPAQDEAHPKSYISSYWLLRRRSPDKLCILFQGITADVKLYGCHMFRIVKRTGWSFSCMLAPVRRSSSASCTKRRSALGIAASGPFFLPTLVATSFAAYSTNVTQRPGQVPTVTKRQAHTCALS